MNPSSGSKGRRPKRKSDNREGVAYAAALRERSMLLRSSLLLSPQVRQTISEDIDALARIAELHPECFRGLK